MGVIGMVALAWSVMIGGVYTKNSVSDGSIKLHKPHIVRSTPSETRDMTPPWARGL